MPAIAEENLDPGAEILRRVRRRQADIADIAGAIARRDVEAAAADEREMRIVAADAAPLLESLRGRARRPRVLVTEANVIMHVAADRLHARPAEGRAAEQVPGNVREDV